MECFTGDTLGPSVVRYESRLCDQARGYASICNVYFLFKGNETVQEGEVWQKERMCGGYRSVDATKIKR